MSALERVLECLSGVRKGESGYRASCPCPDHGKSRGDKDPSLSVGVDDEGNVLLKCFAGCGNESIVAELGLQMADLFERRNGHGGGGSSIPSKNHETVEPCTLANYADYVRLPMDFLEDLGLKEYHNLGAHAVSMPYLDESGENILLTRSRVSLTGKPKIKTRRGDKHRLYGLWKLEEARRADYLWLFEGESDTQTGWYYGEPCAGIPGANGWKREWAAELEGIDRLYFVVEDEAGEKCWEKLAATHEIRERLYRVEFEGAKDVSELHKRDPEGFKGRLRVARESARAWLDIAKTEEQERVREAWAKCEGLAREPRILEVFAEDLKLCGVAGGPKVGQILYLALNSRHLPSKQLVNVAVKGPSSAGKSFVVEKVLGFFPEDTYYFLTSMSERALAYSEESLAHRFLVLAEAAGMSGEFATYLIRSLLSEGRLRYETVEKTAEGMRPRLIEREGPTGLIVTTTRIKLHGENETRMLTVRVDDSPDHTREILEALADEDSEPVDMEGWHALQVWIASGETSVTIPYAKKLSREIPIVAVRQRRDFEAILNLIRSHALLHIASRQRDERGRIIATLEDYAVVRELVADLISEGVEATVPKIVRETVEAVTRLLDYPECPEVNMAQVGRELKRDKNATSQRVQGAIEGGYLENLEERQGRPYRLVLGGPMPEDQSILPEPERLQGFTVSGVSGGIHHPPPPSRATELDAPGKKHFGLDDKGSAR